MEEKEILQTAYLIETGATDIEIMLNYKLGKYLLKARELLKYLKSS